MSDSESEDPNPAEESSASDPSPSSDTGRPPLDEGPGWMPAVMAGTVLLGIFGFICCGVSTWVLYQKRTELAVRTIRGSVLPDIEQSYLPPEEKSAVLAELDELAKEMERGNVEDWQSAGVMQRLQRLPITQWGELEVIEAFIEKSELENKEDSINQISRLRRAVEMGEATSFDVEEVLRPVLVEDAEAPNGRSLNQPLQPAEIEKVVEAARTVADRAEVGDGPYEVSLDTLIRREIESAMKEGGF